MRKQILKQNGVKELKSGNLFSYISSHKIKKEMLFYSMVLSVFFFQSCTTDERALTEEKAPLEIKNEILNFNSVHEYIDLFDNYNKAKFDNYTHASSFISFREARLTASNSKIPIIITDEEDDMDYRIYDLVNHQGFIRLGNYLVRLDFHKERLYVSEKFDSKTIGLMRNGRADSINVFSFSFDYDVTELLELCEENNTPLQKGVRLNETALRAACPAASGKEDSKYKCGDNVYYQGEFAYSAKLKLVYKKFGVYFVIKSKVKNYVVGKVFCNSNDDGQQSITYTRCKINKKKKKCKLFKGCSCQDDWKTDYSGKTFSNAGSVTSHTPYESTRGLQAYSIAVNMTYKGSSFVDEHTKTLHMHSNM